MRTRVTLQLVDELSRYRLLYTCDDCAHFSADPRALCTHGYPIGERRDRILEVGDAIEFCKEFEA